jgi:hypothetical protein
MDPETERDLHDLWHAPGFPHRGWECVDVIDLNPDDDPSEEVSYETCQACGQYPIRFVHVLRHWEWPGEIEVGCVCSERLTCDYVSPKRREQELKRRASIRRRWLTKRWRTSAKGNPWLKVKGHRLVVFPTADGFSCSVDGVFSRYTYPTEQMAKLACLTRLRELGVFRR